MTPRPGDWAPVEKPLVGRGRIGSRIEPGLADDADGSDGDGDGVERKLREWVTGSGGSEVGWQSPIGLTRRRRYVDGESVPLFFRLEAHLCSCEIVEKRRDSWWSGVPMYSRMVLRRHKRKECLIR
jgi:hypothetical protein